MPFNKANLIVEHGLKGFGTTAHADNVARTLSACAVGLILLLTGIRFS